MDAVDQAHLSIGEVLSLLQEEFPDVTISKIRFLESQGLIEPERTPSGYRRFHDPDIERLRWVLRQQRDHFLPLKVIKAKLDEGEPVDQPTLWGMGEEPAQTTALASESAAGRSGATADTTPVSPANAQSPKRSASDPSETAAAGPGASGPPDPGAWLAALQAPPEPATAPHPEPGPLSPRAIAVTSTERISREELVVRSGVDDDHVKALIDFGLLRPTVVAGEELFGADAVEIAALTSQFVELGVGVRNLRSYRLAADREIGVIEALLLPLLKQRNPDARLRAIETADRLAELGGALRSALVRQALAPHKH